jgi:integrase
MSLTVKKRGQTYHYSGTVAGRRLRGTTGTTDKARAERIAAEKESDEWKRHLDGPEAVLTFAKASILYRAAGGESRFLSRIEDYWKDTLIKDIKPGMIRQMAIDLYPNCSGGTRNRQAIVPAQAIINHCHELEMCPPIRVKRFKFEKKIKKPVMLAWLDTFCAHTDRPEIGPLAIFMFATGCRISEAMRLQWKDIDFQNRCILVRKTKNKKERLPHMPQRLLVALANLPRDRPPFSAAQTTLRDAWDRAIEAAARAAGEDGFERLTFHSCRHGFATTLLRDGIDPKTAAGLGGWESIQLFMDTYAHAIQDATLTDRLFPDTADKKSKGKTIA